MIATDEAGNAATRTVAVTVGDTNDVGTVTITGLAIEGGELTATVADADGLTGVTIAYQWQAGGMDIMGATDMTFTPEQAQVGQSITVVVSYTDVGGMDESLTSAKTAPALPVGPAGLDQTVREGAIVTLKAQLRPGSVFKGWTQLSAPLVEFSANARRLTFTAPMISAPSVDLVFRLKFTQGLGLEDLFFFTDVVTITVLHNFEPVGLPFISTLDAVRNRPLHVDVSGISDANGPTTLDFSYQWLANGAPISDATFVIFTPEQAQVGQRISVRVSYTDAGGTIETLTSAKTLSVQRELTFGPAGPDQTVREGAIVTLEAQLRYGKGLIGWSQVMNGAPTVMLSNPRTRRSTFTAPMVSAPSVGLEFQLVYVAEGGESLVVLTDAVTITALRNNEPFGLPVISDLTPTEGEELTAEVSGITDADGPTTLDFSYQWLANGNDISGATDARFTPEQAQANQRISVRVSYTDAGGTIETPTSAETLAVLRILRTNAGPDQTVSDGDRVILDGSRSFFPTGSPMFYIWLQVNEPNVGLLSTMFNANPSFTAPDSLMNDVELVFQLVVTSGSDIFALPDTVTITVIADDPTTTVGTIADRSRTLMQGEDSFDVSVNFADPDVPDSADLTYGATSATEAIATVSISSIGVLTITPVAVGMSVITVTAREGSNTAASQSFTVTVDDSATTFTQIADRSRTLVQGEDSFDVSGNFADSDVPDSTDLTYGATSATEAIATVSISSVGVLTITPVAAGTSEITVTAREGSNTAASQSFTVTVDDSATTFTQIADRSRTLVQGEDSFDVSGNFADADGNPLTYGATSATEAIATVSISSVGVLTITPVAAGTSEITVTAREGSNTAASQSFTVTVDDSATTFTQIADRSRTLVQGEDSFDVSVNFADADGNPLTYGATSATEAIATVSISSVGVLTITLVAVGTSEITVTAQDGSNTAASQSFTVTVDDSATTFTQIADRSRTLVQGEDSFDVSGNFADSDVPDSTDLTYGATSATEAIATVSISSVGVLTITPVAVGMSVITVTAQDGSNTAASQTFTVTVGDSATTFTQIADRSRTLVQGEDSFDVSVNFADPDVPDSADLTYGATSATEAIATVSISSVGVLTITPVAVGTSEITVTAREGSNTAASQSFTVTVDDSATTFTQIADRSRTLVQGEDSFDVSGNFADSDVPDSTDLTYGATSATEAIATVSISSVGVLTITPVAVGTSEITVTAQDGSNTAASQSFTVTVGDSATTFTQIADRSRTLVQGEDSFDVSVNFADADGNPLTYGATSATEAIATVSISSVGVLTITLVAVGTSEITVTAQDGSNTAASQTFTVTVDDSATTFTQIADRSRTLVQGEDSFDVSVNFADADGNPLTYGATSATEAIATVSISSIGVLTITPVAVGTSEITVTAREGSNTAASQSFTVTVDDSATTFTQIADRSRTLVQGEDSFDVSVNFADADGNPLTYGATSATEAIATVSISSVGVLTITPVAAGTSEITVTAREGSNTAASQSFTVTVDDSATTFTQILDQILTFAGGAQELTVTVNFADPDVPDSADLTYGATSATEAIATVSISSVGVLTITPVAVGTSEITVTAREGSNTAASQSFTVTVGDSATTFTQIADRSRTLVQGEDSFDVSVNFADADGNPLTYGATSATEAIATVSISSVGVLTITPVAAGTSEITVTAREGSNTAASQSFTVTVDDSATTFTQILDQILTFAGGAQELTVTVNFADPDVPDSADLTYGATSATEAIATVSISSVGVLTITPVAVGTSEITVTAREGSNTAASQSFTVTVGDSATTFTQIADRSRTLVQGEDSFDVSGNFADADGNPLTYGATSATEAIATVSISSVGVLTITLVAVGTSEITVTAQDGSNTAASQSFTVTVDDSATTFTQIADRSRTLVQGEDSFDVSVNFADPDVPDSADLTYGATSATEAIATVSISSIGVLTITPVAVGTSEITVTAQDGSNTAASQTFTVTVDDSATTFTQIADRSRTLMQGEDSFDVSVNFADSDVPDSTDLTYGATSATEAIATVSISSVGVLTITPVAVGMSVITVTAREGSNTAASQSFTVTVDDSATTFTQIADRSRTLVQGEDSFDVSGNFADSDVPDSTDLTYGATSATEAIATVSISSVGVLTITPVAVGTSEITVTAQDGSNTAASQSFTVTVGDSATTFTQIADRSRTLVQGEDSFDVSVNFADPDVPDSADLTYGATSATEAIATVSISSVGVLTITPVAAGTSEITVTAQDGSNTAASQTFTVTVDDSATTFTQIADRSQTLVQGEDSFDVSVNFADPDVPDSADLTYGATSATEAIATVSISSVGVLTITPVAVGMSVITVTAREGSNTAASQSFTVTVDDSATTFTQIADRSRTLVQGEDSFDVSGNFADADGNPLTYGATSATEAIATVSISSVGVLTITPVAVGTSEITVTAQDGSNAATSQTFTVTVDDSATTFTQIADRSRTLVQGEDSFDVSGNFADSDVPDSTDLTYGATSATEAIATVSISSVGVLTITPVAVGMSVITVTAREGSNTAASQSFTVTVGDSATTFTQIADRSRTLVQGEDSFDVSGNFADSDVPDSTDLTYGATSATEAIATVSISSVGVLTITPVAVGTSEITVTAQDGSNAATSQTFTVTVDDSATTFTQIADRSRTLVQGEDSFDVSGNFADADGNPLTYGATSATEAIATVSISSVGVLTITPVAVGMSVITVTAREGSNTAASQTFTVTVDDSATTFTQIADRSRTLMQGEDSFDVSGNFADSDVPDSTDLTYGATSATEAIATVSISSVGVLTITPVAAGTSEITVTAQDGSNTAASQTFTVTVGDSATTFTQIADRSQTLVQGEDSFDVSVNFADADGNPLTYGAASATEAIATVSISSVGVLTITPVAVGMSVITVTAQDGSNTAASQSFTVTVDDSATTFTQIADRSRTLVQGEDSFDVSGNFADPDVPDSTDLTYGATSATEAIATVSISSVGVLTITPVAVGTSEITVTAQDGSNTAASQSFTVTVGDSATTFTQIADRSRTLVQGEDSFDVSGNFADADGNPLTYGATSATEAIATVSISSVGVLTITLVAVGTSEITVTAQDGSNTAASQTFTVTVDDSATTFTQIADRSRTLVQGEDSFDVSGNFADPDVPDSTDLTYGATSATEAIATVSISSVGVLTITLVAAGTSEITVTAREGSNTAASQSFMVTVDDSATTFTQIADRSRTLVQGEDSFDVSGNFADSDVPDSTDLTYGATSATEAIATVSISSVGVLTITPVAVGMSVITVTAREGSNTAASQTFTVTVDDSATTFTQIADRSRTLMQGEDSFDVSGNFADSDVPDSTDLTYGATSATEAIATVSISSVGVLTITPVAAGTSEITVTAQDGSNTAASQTFTVTVGDSATTFTQIADRSQTLVQGEDSFDVSVNFADADGNPLTYGAASATEAIATVSISSVGVLTITPVAVGMSVITVTAREGSNTAASQSFTVTVDDSATTFTQIADRSRTLMQGEDSFDVSVNFADPDVPDSADLTYGATSATEAIATVSISSIGVLTITPVAVGTSEITVTAQDGSNTAASQTFTVTVDDSATTFTQIADRSRTLVQGEDSFDVSGNFADSDVPDSTDLTYGATSATEAIATVSISSVGVLTITLVAVGTSEITVTAQDGSNTAASQTFTVTVDDSATTFTQIADRSRTLVQGEDSFDVSGNFADSDVPDSTDLTYGATSATEAIATVSISSVGVLTITPVAVGMSVITVTAQDGSNTAASQTFTVTVDDSATTFTQIADRSRTLVQGEDSFDVSGNFADSDVPDSTDLTYGATSATEAIATVSISSVGVLTITPVAAGTSEITVTAREGSNTAASQSFTVTVDDSATTFTQIADRSRTLVQGEDSFDVSGNFADADGNPLTYGATSATEAIATVSISSVGVLTITPVAAGTSEITVTAREGSNTAASQSFTVTVDDSATTFTQIADRSRTLVQGEDSFDVSVNFADADGNPLTYGATSATEAIATVSISSVGVLTITLVAVGTSEITVTAQDGSNTAASQTFTVTVDDSATTFTQIADRSRTLVQGEDSFDVSGNFADSDVPDSTDLTYGATSATEAIATVSISSVGVLTITPVAVGMSVITVTAQDGSNTAASQTFTVTVGDSATTFTQIADRSRTLVQGEDSFDVSVNFADPDVPDSADLTYGATSATEAIATVSISSIGVLTITPVAVGTSEITVTAREGSNTAASQSFTVTVDDSATTFTQIADRSRTLVQGEDSFDVSVNFADADGNPLTYGATSATEAIATVSISSVGVLTITLVAVGTSEITVTAQDGSNTAASQTFTVTVDDSATTFTQIADRSRTLVQGEDSFDVSGNFADSDVPDSTDLTYGATSATEAIATVSISSVGVLTITLVAVGTSEITVTAQDGSNTAASQTFTVTVDDSATTFTQILDQILTFAGGAQELTVTGNFADSDVPDSTDLTYGATSATEAIATVSISSVGVLTITPVAVGMSVITVTAQDGSNTAASQSFTVTVGDSATTFTQIADRSRTLVQGEDSFDVSVNFADADGNPLTYGATSATEAIATVSISSVGVLTITPVAVGTSEITVTAREGSNTAASQSFTVTVDDSATTFTQIADRSRTLVQGEDSFDVSVNFADADGNPLTYGATSATEAIATVSISSVGVLTITLVAVGTSEITVTAQDGSNTAASQSFTVTVDDSATTFTQIADRSRTLVQGEDSFDVSGNFADSDVPDSTDLTYGATSATEAIATVSISSVGVLTITPVAVGMSVITVTAQDGSNTAASQTFTVTVDDSATTFTQIADRSRTLVQGEDSFDVSGNFADSDVPDSTDLTYGATSATEAIATVSISSVGVLTITPVAAGTSEITVTAREGSNTAASQSFTVTVDDSATTFTQIADRSRTLVQGEDSFDVSGNFADSDVPDSTDLTYGATSATEAIATVSISSVGVLTITPVAVGTSEITVTAQDGSNTAASQSFTVTVGDSATTFTQILDQILTFAGGAQELTVTGNFADSDVPDSTDLTYGATSATEAIATVSISSVGVLTITPVAVGTSEITVTAQDGSNTAASQSFTVTVGDSATTFTQIADRSRTLVQGEDSFDVSGNFADADGNPLTYGATSATEAIATVSISSVGVLTITLVAVGTSEITVTAREGSNTAASQSFTVTVDDSATTFTQIADRSRTLVQGEDSFDVSVNFADPDVPDSTDLTYGATSATEAIATVSISSVGVLTITPVAVGTSEITVTAQDGSNTAASQTFTVTVDDSATTFTQIADRSRTLVQGEDSFDVSVNFADADGNPLTYGATSATEAIATVSISSVGVLTITPVAVGMSVITVTAQDGSNTAASQTFTVTVGDSATTFTQIADRSRTLVQGEDSFDVSGNFADSDVPDSTDLTYGATSATEAIATVSISSVGVLTITPVAVGMSVITVTAQDGSNTAASQTFTVTVGDSATTFTQIADRSRTLVQGEDSFDVSVNFADPDVPDSADLTYGATSATEAIATVSISSVGVLTITPVAVGTSEITVTAQDGSNTAASQSFTVTVGDSATTFTQIADRSRTLVQGEDSFDVSVNFADADGNPLTYGATSATEAIATVSISSVGVLTITPVAVGMSVITVTAQDGSNTAASQTFTVTVDDSATTFTQIADRSRTLVQGEDSFDVSVNFADPDVPDSADLTYGATSATEAIATVSISSVGVLTITPVAVGTSEITVTAREGSNTAASQSFTVTVDDSATTFTQILDQILTFAGGAQELTVTGNFADSDVPDSTDLTYGATSATESIATVSISSVGVLTITPVAVGTSEITVTAQDGSNTAASQSFTVTVGDSATTFTQIADRSRTLVQGEDSFDVSGNFADADGNPLTYGATSATEAIATVSISSVGVLTITLVAVGTSEITVTAQDGSNTAASQSFTVTVDDSATTFTQIADRSRTLVQGEDSFDVSVNFADPDVPDSADLTYGATSATEAIATVSISSIGVLTITPVAVGTSEITVTAQDGSNTAASQTFTVTVDDSATTFTQIADRSRTLMQGEDSFDVSVNFADSDVPDSTDLTYGATSATEAIATVSISSVGVLTITPVAVGMSVITVTAREGSNTAASQSFTVTVDDSATTFTQIADRSRTLVQGEDSFDVSGNFADSDVPDSTDLTYGATSATEAIATVSISSVGVLTITPVAVGMSVITVTAQDGSNTAASQTFTVTVGDSATTFTQIADRSRTLVQGEDSFDVSVNFADADGNPLTYGATSATEAIATVSISSVGVLTITPVAVGMSVITVTAQDGSNTAASQTFTVTVGDSATTFTQIADRSRTLVQGEDSFDVSGNFADSDVPDSTDLTYGATSATEAIATVSISSVGVLTITPVAVGMSVITVTAQDGSNAEVSQSFTVTVDDSATTFTQLHDVVLSRFTQALVAKTVKSVGYRVTSVFSGAPQVASYTLDGQTVQLDGELSAGLRDAMMKKLPTYAKSLQDDTMDWKQMLSDSSFVLPLNAAGDGGAGNAGLTVWGSGDYTKMSGKSTKGSNLDWDGNVTGFQLGIDGRRDDLLTGGLVSFSKGSVNYTQDNTKGTYEHKMTSIHPYMVWSNEGVNLWGSAGYGRGKLKIDRDGDKDNAKTTMLSLSGGVKRKLAQQGMSLKGDISLVRTKVGALTGDVKADEETVKSQQFRLILESTRQRTLESGGTVTPVLEAGLRYDGGSGESGIGAILGAGIRFNDAVTGLTVEGKVYALLGRKDYTEWGVSGVIRKAPSASQYGLSFSLSPSYGKTDSKAEKLWDQALPVGDSDNTDDYDMRVTARLDYGLSAPGRNGLLIPYSEMTVGDESDRYLLGINWKRSPSFGIDVSGERKDSTKKYVLGTTWKGSIFDTKLTGEREESGTIKHSVLLESTIRF